METGKNKLSINTSKYAIYYPQITSLFSEHQADGLRLLQCIVASVSEGCRTSASVGPHKWPQLRQQWLV